MADNTALSVGAGGDTIRDVDKGGIKTQVTILDLGGAGAESLFSVGQKLAVSSISVVLASDQATIPVSLAAGFSTSALQTSGNASLTSIDGKTPALGQALAAASVPVVLTAAQLTTLTPPAAITGFLLDSTFTTRIPVQGQAAMAASVPVVIASNQSAIPASQSGTWNIGTVTTLTGITNALPAGTNVIGHVIADTGSTTAVTGNVTVVQPTGTNLHTVLDSGTLTSITNPVAVTVAATLPVSAASLPLPANAAQESSGNLAYLAQTVEQNTQIIKLLGAILMTLGNNGGGFVDPEEAANISTLQ